MTALTASRDVILSVFAEAPASTETSEARRAGSSEAPKSAGRDVGWIDCQFDGDGRNGVRKRKHREG
jgi:hypothetical protein